MKFRPVGERILVKAVEREEKTESGIFLPETAKERPQTAKVVAVGDSSNGGPKEGDVIVFAKFSGTEIKLEDVEHMILDSDDVLGIIE